MLKRWNTETACRSWYEDSLLVPGLMAGQPHEAEPVPLCLFLGHNLSIIQDRPLSSLPLIRPAPSPGPSRSPGAVSRPFSVQAFSLPAAVSCHLLCPRVVAQLVLGALCMGSGTQSREDWTVESCSSNCHLDLLFISQNS